MKYIGGLPAHIRNIVFMFGPTNLDEVSVQATYIEAGKAYTNIRTSWIKKQQKLCKCGKCLMGTTSEQFSLVRVLSLKFRSFLRFGN